MKWMMPVGWCVALVLALIMVWASRKYRDDPAAFKPYRFGIGIPFTLLCLFLAYVSFFGWPF